MPEMPEVETMVGRLQDYVGMEVLWASPTSEAGYKGLPEEVQIGQKLKGVFRRGKFIVFMLERDAILTHNAMSGYWDVKGKPWTFDYVEGKRTSKESDVRVELELEDPDGPEEIIVLQFHDARKFGSLRIVSPSDLAAKLSELGPEVMTSKHLYEPSAVIDEATFVEVLRKSKKPVKEVMMDQGKIAGLGNIYAAEACWVARTDPFRAGNTLTEGAAAQLYHASVMVLQSALDRSLDYSGLHVYRRKTCGLCDPIVEIKSAKLKGRTTYWCPSCQK